MSNTRLLTSVVIATYNGEKYIEEQLLSIYQQTQKVDEVLIFDDRSTDHTIKICKRFINYNQLENWIIKVNQKKLGVFYNFINGAYSSNGDIIFFADQDDIWLEHKVATMTNLFSSNQKVLSLTTTFSRFRDDVVLSNHVKHPNRKNNGLKKIHLNEFCKFPNYLGMSMAISKNLLKIINFKKQIEIVVTHDIYLNFFSAQNQSLYHLDKVLTKRRSYSNSVSNKKVKTDLVYFNNNIKLYTISDKLMMLKFFKKEIKNNIDNKKTSTEIVKRHIRFNNIRFDYFKNKSILKWLKSIILLRYYNSFLSYFSDGFEIVNSYIKVKITRDA